MDENRVIYKTGTSVRIKINKVQRSSSLDIYLCVDGRLGKLEIIDSIDDMLKLAKEGLAKLTQLVYQLT